MAKYFFISVILSSCIDYVNINEEETNKKYYNFKPVIDHRHLSPKYKGIVQVSVGHNCKGQTFKVPPINDNDEKDKLYCLWFLDEKLASEMQEIEPNARDILTFKIDKNFLEDHFDQKIPLDFFDKSHVIEFYISDKPYVIPESRYIDDELNHSDMAHWIFFISNDPC